MKNILSDTDPKIEKVLINLIRQKSVPQKLSVMASLCSLTINLSKRAIARNNPGKSKMELDLLFVKYNYGDDLYNNVRNYVSKIGYGEK